MVVVPNTMTRFLAVAGIFLYAADLYCLLYAAARGTHQLVRNQGGCVSRPGGGFLEPVPSCEEFERIDRAEGRTMWQVAFRPLIAIEERLRRPASG